MGTFNDRCDWCEARKKRLFSNFCSPRCKSEAEYEGGEEPGCISQVIALIILLAVIRACAESL